MFMGVIFVYYGSIEAGGTKFVCAIGNEELEILERVSFPTTTPEETMSAVIDYFKKYQDEFSIIDKTARDLSNLNKLYQLIIQTTFTSENNQKLQNNLPSCL